MKDLKHLLYFENLLQEAQNELILQAQSEGKVCVAYVCENTPEPLLNLPGAFSARLRAPRTGSMEMATYYMTSFLCEYSRALLERANRLFTPPDANAEPFVPRPYVRNEQPAAAPKPIPPIEQQPSCRNRCRGNSRRR